MTFKLTVLSIDGGGIKGIVPAMILAEIEKRTDRRIYELFDLIAGTSTGGILSLGLTKPNEDKEGKPFSAEELVELYTKEGEKIFEERKEIPNLPFSNLPIQLLEPLFNFLNFNIKPPELFNSKYKRSGKSEVIKTWLGEKTPLDQALTEVIITSYETSKRMPLLFTSNCAKENLNSDNFLEICSDYKMYDAAMATSAAPTFFKSHFLKLRNSKNQGYALIDGGVIANNPTSIAIVEAMKSYEIKMKDDISLPEILVVSLGTGRMTDSFSADKINKWGLIQWVKPLINIVFSGQSELIDYQMDRLLSKKQQQYYRFQLNYINSRDKFSSVPEDYDNVNDAMDDASPENINKLKRATKEFLEITKVDSDLEELCKVLLTSLETRELLK
jgi:patatin-like phospholipase/acyl hydrolase